MKKIILSLVTSTLISFPLIAKADDLLAWAQYGTGTYVAPGCSWQAGGATPKGTIYNLICNGSFAASRTPNSPAPEIISATGNYYAVPRAGGAGTPINGYNYAIYKRSPVCSTKGTVVGTYPYLQNASANISSDAQKCGPNCSIDIVANGPQYNNVCR